MSILMEDVITEMCKMVIIMILRKPIWQNPLAEVGISLSGEIEEKFPFIDCDNQHVDPPY